MLLSLAYHWEFPILNFQMTLTSYVKMKIVMLAESFKFFESKSHVDLGGSGSTVYGPRQQSYSCTHVHICSSLTANCHVSREELKV